MGERLALSELVRSGGPILGECSSGTRLHLQSPLPTEEQLGLVPLVDDELGAAAVRAVSAGYAATAAEFGLPIVIDAPTWWARKDRLADRGIVGADADRILLRSAELLLPIRDRFDSVYVSASLGPSTDGYRAGDVDYDTAVSYHHWSVDRLAATDVDFLLAATFSTTIDLEAVANVLASTDRPYVLGPVVDTAGCLPDGAPLHEVVDRIESEVVRPPMFWAVCCTHPEIAGRAMDAIGAADSRAHDRVQQLKGNGSMASDEERDAADHVLCDEPEPWAIAAMRLREDHDLAIVGGCCGTDDRHLLSLAIRLADSNR
jgi:homocysteine S-methyltransferase